MRNRILLLAFCVFSTIYCHSRVTYVQIGANGLKNGTSWANAYPNLDSLLKFGGSLDSVWVANGIHKVYGYQSEMPLVDSTKLFGGFDGSETYIWQRNWSNFLTILDAQWQFSTTVHNATVVAFGAASKSSSIPFHCRLDGFRVTGAQIWSPNPNFARYAPIMINARSGTATNPEGYLILLLSCFS